MDKQQEKVALVTGASRGIGAAVARRLAADGYALVLNYARGADEAQALAGSLRAAGARAITVRADVADAAQVRAMFDAAQAQFGGIDVLVNNAGVMTTSALADTSDALFAQAFAVNVQGSFNTMREAAGRMRDGGRIINVSTSVLAMNLPGYGVYSASKAAVESLTRVLARELRGRAVTVNAVAPGPVATELFMRGKTPQQVEHFARLPPLERLGAPEDIAAAVAFLAGPDGAWINGQVLRANGGTV